MGKTSAGLLMYRWALSAGERELEVFLGHPGGPYFRRRDDGWWSIPKGEREPAEALESTARREFNEEIGIDVTTSLIALGSCVQKGGKTVHAWAFEGDWTHEGPPPCNTFEIEWPPRSGQRQAFPEVDRVAFFGLDAAKVKINAAQAVFLDRLVGALEHAAAEHDTASQNTPETIGTDTTGADGATIETTGLTDAGATE